MYDCPRCKGVETLRYNLYYDVFICLACGVSAMEDFDDDVVIVDHVERDGVLEPISEYIVPVEHVDEGEIDYNILTKLRENRVTATDRVVEGTSHTRRTRKKSETSDVTDK